MGSKRVLGVTFHPSVEDKTSSPSSSSSSSSLPKRVKDNTENELAAQEAEALETLTKTDIKKLMSSTMAECECVLLKADGTTEELKLDMTPSAKQSQKVLGGDISLMGQWEDIEVILVVNAAKQEEEDEKCLNQHKLQPPFHDAKVFGDILLQRSDDLGNPKALPLGDYVAFTKLKIAEWKPAEDDFEDEDDDEEEEEEEEEEEDEDEDDFEGDEDDEDDDEDEDGQSEIEAMYLDVLKKKVITQYNAVHGKDPTDEEAEDLARRLLTAISGAEGEGEGEEGKGEEEEEEGDAEQDETPAPNVFGFGQ